MKLMAVVSFVGLACAVLRGLVPSPSTELRRSVPSVAAQALAPLHDPRDEAPGIDPPTDTGGASEDAELSLLATNPGNSTSAETTVLSELAIAASAFSAAPELVSPSTPAWPSQAISQTDVDQSAQASPRQTVVAILDEVSRMADVENVATAIPPLELPQATTADPSPAMTLPLFPPTRLVTLADKLRLREPQWLVRLEVTPEFRVQPSDAQVLSARQSLMWSIQPTAPPPAVTSPTRLIVQVDSVSPRQAALRWRLAAVAEDFPRLLFPMDSHLLEVLRRRLKEHLQWLEVQQQVHQQTVRNSSLPNEVRSMWSQQRQLVQEQLALAQRSVQIVSEAAQLLAGLDGQLDVHVSLSESGVDHSPPLLQLGSP